MPLNVSFSTGLKAQLTLQDIRDIYLATRDWSSKTPIRVGHTPADRPMDRDMSLIEVTQDQRLEQEERRQAASSYIDPRGPNA